MAGQDGGVEACVVAIDDAWGFCDGDGILAVDSGGKIIDVLAGGHFGLSL